jgi:Leucine-rich repeat (LRR) protein
LLLYDFTGLSNADLGLLVRALPQLRGMRMRHGLACSKPPFAGVLRQLRARHLSHYPYSRDWDVFRLLPSWTNLQHLSLREVNLPLDNSIPPDTCSSLVRLSSLVLNDTDVSNEGLAVLCSATRLKHLELDCTRHVTALPDAISRLTSLKTLIMCGVNILGLPESATALRSLRNLTWCTDGVTAAPRLQLVWELRSLEQLSIAFNTTLSLSSAIGQLTGLRQLHIHGGLEELPVGISRLVGLERITLWSSSLRELPSSITALTRLSCIRLHCSQLQDLPPPVQAFVQPRQQLLGPFGWA